MQRCHVGCPTLSILTFVILFVLTFSNRFGVVRVNRFVVTTLTAHQLFFARVGKKHDQDRSSEEERGREGQRRTDADVG